MKAKLESILAHGITPLALAAGLLLGSGCATGAARIRANSELFDSLPANVQGAVRAGQVGLGFRADVVRLALGEPTRVIRRTDSDGETEIWDYFVYDLTSGPSGWDSAYLGEAGRRIIRDRFSVEFRGGVVTAIVSDQRN